MADDDGKLRIKFSSRESKDVVCKACKRKGHTAGFVGSVYKDCPNRACYLCKEPGHTTQECPHRVSAVQSSLVDKSSVASRDVVGVTKSLSRRELCGSKASISFLRKSSRWKLKSAALTVHSRRVTHMKFHPVHHGLLMSGDKYGELSLWNFEEMSQPKVTRPHHGIIGAMSMRDIELNQLYTVGIDGTLKMTHLDTQETETLLNLNPGGWQNDPSNWRMVYALAAYSSSSSSGGTGNTADPGFVLVGDDFGSGHLVDPRDHSHRFSVQLHPKKKKITCLDMHPSTPHLVASCGNDYKVRLWDVRRLKQGGDVRGGSATVASPLLEISHPRIPNSAYFSPVTGNKLLTTCQDNRIRVFPSIQNAHLPSAAEAAQADGSPGGAMRSTSAGYRSVVEIVHSHDFNRYLTPFRAVWDPKDSCERLIACGRYISEDFGGHALHPIDLFDADTGTVHQQLVHLSLPTICPVNVFHPHRPLIATGSSRSLYLWEEGPSERMSEEEEEASQRGRRQSKAALEEGRWGAGAGGAGVVGTHPHGRNDSEAMQFFDCGSGQVKEVGGSCWVTESLRGASGDGSSKATAKQKRAKKSSAKQKKNTTTELTETDKTTRKRDSSGGSSDGKTKKKPKK